MTENWPKIGPEIPGQIAFRYPKHHLDEQTRKPHQAQLGRPSIHADIVLSQKLRGPNAPGRARGGRFGLSWARFAAIPGPRGERGT